MFEHFFGTSDNVPMLYAAFCELGRTDPPSERRLQLLGDSKT